jgi:hypothetical protein
MQKTFDQFLSESGTEGIGSIEIAPHKLIPTNIVLEPNSHQGVARVRVTARDKDFKLLWGVNVSEGLMPAESPTPVAFYGRLREVIREHLSAPAPRHEITDDPFVAVQFCLNRIREMLSKCEKETLSVKKKSDTTETRASKIANILFDTLRQMNYDLSEIGIASPTTSSETKEPN